MRAQSGRPSMASIAAELGISTASVSNALNQPSRVSDALRERVLEVANRVGYAGAAAATRRLPEGRSRTVGIVFTADIPTALRSPAGNQFLEGLAATCNRARISLLLICADEESAGGMLASIRDAVVDAFVLCTVREGDPILPAVLSRGLPTVIVDSPRGVRAAAWVGSDDQAASMVLGRHLRALGHRSVGLIAPQLNMERQNGQAVPQRWDTSGHLVMRSRITGLLAGLDLPATSVPIEERFEPSAATGADALHALLDRHPELTAVACLTDELALGALTAVRQRGLRIPEDLTVTGFDDIPEAARVGLTTIAQAHYEKGRLAGELFLTLGGGGDAHWRTLPTHLEIRSSSGPPRR